MIKTLFVLRVSLHQVVRKPSKDLRKTFLERFSWSQRAFVLESSTESLQNSFASIKYRLGTEKQTQSLNYVRMPNVVCKYSLILWSNCRESRKT